MDVSTLTSDSRILVVGMAGGLGLTVSSITWYLLVKQIIPAIEKAKIRSLSIIKKNDVNNWVANWIAEMEPRLKKARFGMAADRLFLIVMVVAVLAFLIGVFYLKNFLAAACLASLAVMIPDQLIITRIEARRNRMNEQLSPVIQMLYSEMATSRNPQLALDFVANRAPEPLGSVLKQVVWHLGTRSASPDEAFANLADQLDFEYGRLFAQVLREIWDGRQIQNMLPRMAQKCAAYQRMVRKTKSELTWFRVTGTIMNVLTVPVFVSELLFMPDARVFLTTTTIGKLIVAICCLSILVGTLLNRILSKVDY